MSNLSADEHRLSAAWQEAARDLGFRFTAPFVDTLSDGSSFTYAGLVHGFGGPKGALLAVYERGRTLGDYPHSDGYHLSLLNVASYGRYDRELYIDTLDDFGWFGPEQEKPLWYSGKAWT